MKQLPHFVAISLLLTACVGSTSALRYKKVTTEWPERHCIGIAKDENDVRVLDHQKVGDAGFGFEVCTTQQINPEKDYTGPVVVRVFDRGTSKVLAENTWDSYNPSSTTFALGGDKAFINFSDGKHSFTWEANASQLAQASAAPKPQVLDYPNCIRQSFYSSMEQVGGYMFEYCYLSLEGSYDALKANADAGVLRLSTFPNGEELRVERQEKVSVENVIFEEGKIRFENNGQSIEWELPK